MKTESEFISLYNAIDEMSIKEKRLAAEEFGLSTAKAELMKKEILLVLRDFRSKKNEFSEDDINFANRIDYPWGTPKKLNESLKNESIAFLRYYLNKLIDDMKSHKISADSNLYEFATVSSKKIPANRWNYYISFSDIWKVKRYINLVKYITDNDSDFKESNMSKEEKLINLVINTLNDQMIAFHDLYISRIESSASYYYDNLPEKIKECKAMYEKAKKTYYDFESEMCNLWNSYIPKNRLKEKEMRPRAEELRKNRDKIEAKYRILKNIFKRFPTKASYIIEAINEGEAAYNYNIANLADRIVRTNVNVNKMVVSNVANDPKFFEMKISDGIVNLYARSIWAAEYSEKVTPHFRFIITNRKN